ncbi:MAG: DUF1488 domain-containing protein [Gammaproteobacteria bacterium]|nr:DUF1488 domain-containing protein [Gammaproteobacteria bacterium]MDH5802835.1 DUF1488 domain-containing protein [Gammaproteobacteria bacterium]
MKLSFPNPSRSFDANKNRVLFWGYDSAIEVSFFVEADALNLTDPHANCSEADFLQAFDALRKRIYEVANKVYMRGGKGTYSYVLGAKDFDG